MRFVAKITLGLGLAYAIFLAGFLLLKQQLIYPFVETIAAPADMPRTRVKYLPGSVDDPQLEVWVTEPLPGRPVVIYFMGFTGALSVHEPRLRALGEAGFGVAAMAYRGGGGQPGVPGQMALLSDARRLVSQLDTLFDAPVPPEDRIFYGYSRGSGLAIPIAAENEELALVLEAPFDSMCALLERRFVILPACFLMWDDTYESVGRIRDVDSVVYFLHGSEDLQVPLEAGRALFLATPDPKFVRIYARGTHEDLARFEADKHTVRFINTLRGAP